MDTVSIDVSNYPQNVEDIVSYPAKGWTVVQDDAGTKTDV